MTAPRKKPISRRRKPLQARAVASQEAILSAATQILGTRGPAGLTTNRIAARAGVSIGTLYQYFRDKEEILVMVARRLLADDRAALLAAIAEAAGSPDAELDRVAIRETIRRYQIRPRVRRLVMETMIGLGRIDEVSAPVQEVAALLSRLTGQSGGDASWDMRLFVASRAAEASVRVAAYEGTAFFGTPAFEEALLTLVRALLPELSPGARTARTTRRST